MINMNLSEFNARQNNGIFQTSLNFEKCGSLRHMSVDINSLLLRHSTGLTFHWARNGMQINFRQIKYLYSDTQYYALPSA